MQNFVTMVMCLRYLFKGIYRIFIIFESLVLPSEKEGVPIPTLPHSETLTLKEM